LIDTPSCFALTFICLCSPPVMPSMVRDSAIKASPKTELEPEDFLPRDTRVVPAMMAATEAYSRSVYLAPPSRIDPIITGTILPDLANVTTGNDTPCARAERVNAFAKTCETPP